LQRYQGSADASPAASNYGIIIDSDGEKFVLPKDNEFGEIIPTELAMATVVHDKGAAEARRGWG